MNATLGVIFDCDGTLLASMDAWREIEGELARRAGSELSLAERDELATLTIPEVGAFFHDRYGVGDSPEDVVAIVGDFMHHYYTHRVQARPGIMAFVEGLAAAGVPMAVASSTPSELLRAGLKTAGLAPYMRAIVSVDDVGKSKRDPDVFDKARESLGTDAHATWGFEDSIYAIRTLKCAGYRTFGVYDCDLNATFASLQEEADMAVKDSAELDAAAFLAAAL